MSTIDFPKAIERLKTSLVNVSVCAVVSLNFLLSLMTTQKPVGKVYEKHIANLYFYFYVTTSCSCFFSTVTFDFNCALFFSLFFFFFFWYVKLENALSYQVLVEICKFLIISIFSNLPMLVCLFVFFCRIYKREKLDNLHKYSTHIFKQNIIHCYNGRPSYQVVLKGGQHAAVGSMFLAIFLSHCFVK